MFHFLHDDVYAHTLVAIGGMGHHAVVPSTAIFPECFTDVFALVLLYPSENVATNQQPLISSHFSVVDGLMDGYRRIPQGFTYATVWL